ncbi:DUF423 domain-containing protein [Polluticoccus soli]|uniref:DUF423 domain-containing protein n=1 Tax=Polluticoccus soli TaxID=3034150 RepID=UPI0023E2DBE6|nr:DUF423 domain-containing protein [Flavipsychrobacter sp. JY13-12]
MYKTALVAGVFFAALAVVLGAFGAHGLKPLLTPDQLQTFETGVKYEFYHALALLATGIIYSSFPQKLVKTASTCFIVGILLFSGSLYAMTALKLQGDVGLGGLGILTPIGGLFFIIGWLLLLLGIVRKK